MISFLRRLLCDHRWRTYTRIGGWDNHPIETTQRCDHCDAKRGPFPIDRPSSKGART